MLHKLDQSILRLSPAARLEMKATASGEVTGLGAVFNAAPDAYGDVIAPGAFAASLRDHQERGTMPVMLWQHDPAQPIGVWREVRETAAGLEVRGELDLNVQRGREALSLIKSGALRGLSIGYRVAKDGAEVEGATRILVRVDLWEVSLVTFPAMAGALITDAKSIRGARDFEAALIGMGFPKAAARKLVADGWAGLDGKSTDDWEAAELAAELRRVGAAFR